MQNFKKTKSAKPNDQKHRHTNRIPKDGKREKHQRPSKYQPRTLKPSLVAWRISNEEMGGKPLKRGLPSYNGLLKYGSGLKFFTRSPIPSTYKMNTKPTKEVL